MHLIPFLGSHALSLIRSLGWSLGFVLGMSLRAVALILVLLKGSSNSIREGFNAGFEMDSD